MLFGASQTYQWCWKFPVTVSTTCLSRKSSGIILLNTYLRIYDLNAIISPNNIKKLIIMGAQRFLCEWLLFNDPVTYCSHIVLVTHERIDMH
jgi:hypothetical protein